MEFELYWRNDDKIIMFKEIAAVQKINGILGNLDSSPRKVLIVTLKGGYCIDIGEGEDINTFMSEYNKFLAAMREHFI